MQIDNVINQLECDGHYELADFLRSHLEGLKQENKELKDDATGFNYASENYRLEIEGLKGEVERLTNERDTVRGFVEVYEQAHKEMKEDRKVLQAEVERYRTALKAAGIPEAIINEIGNGVSHDKTL